MRVTRRFWVIVAFGGLLVGVAGVTNRPPALVGATTIGAWLLTTQFVAARSILNAPDSISVRLSLNQDHTTVEETVRATLHVERTGSTDIVGPVRVVARVPAGLTGPARDGRTVRLGADETKAEATFELHGPVVGEFTFSHPEVTITDWSGQFTETVALGEAPTLPVEPPAFGDIHVGKGGERISGADHDRPIDRSRLGEIPDATRRYTSGDSLAHVNWNATARFTAPHVREHEIQTDRQTMLVVDHRSTMRVGSRDASMLDYARTVAADLTAASHARDDPIGCCGVGDEGTTTLLLPRRTVAYRRAIRDWLAALKPTRVAGSNRTEGSRTRGLARESRSSGGSHPGGESAFATTLRPFVETGERYAHRTSADPLTETTRRVSRELDGSAWIVLLTDDTHREETREAARIASTAGVQVSVFLTPRVLYEVGALGAPASAFERYVRFEEFRRDLDAVPSVSAFEVAPANRRAAVRAAGGPSNPAEVAE